MILEGPLVTPLCLQFRELCGAVSSVWAPAGGRWRGGQEGLGGVVVVPGMRAEAKGVGMRAGRQAVGTRAELWPCKRPAQGGRDLPINGCWASAPRAQSCGRSPLALAGSQIWVWDEW